MHTETLQTHAKTVEGWEQLFIDYLSSSTQGHSDASHDLGHFRRVYHVAEQIARDESISVDPLIILAAAYFHDIVSLPKNHPDNNMSSRYAAIKTKEILLEMDFPSEKIDPVCHAIATHSFSAQLQPETMEAKIIQDADRMESLGVLGAMRTFYVTGRIGREPYDPNDLYAERRPLDDKAYGLDHFYVKLFKLPGLLQTEGGRRLAQKRVTFLNYFVEELEANIEQKNGGGSHSRQRLLSGRTSRLTAIRFVQPLRTESSPRSYLLRHRSVDRSPRTISGFHQPLPVPVSRGDGGGERYVRFG